MSNRQQLANAIRFLSMDAVQKAKSGHPVHRWEWRISLKCYGVISCTITQPTHNGPTVTVLYCLTATVPC